nr:hypothetical protein [Candidatus Nitrosocosmicus hydrocola]
MTNQDSETVSVIDHDNNVVDTKPVGESPRGVAYNTGNENMLTGFTQNGCPNHVLRQLVTVNEHDHILNTREILLHLFTNPISFHTTKKCSIHLSLIG